MGQVRIGIDGYNLAMPNGTGIATYGVMLGRSIRAIGHALDGVFGLDVGAGPDTREALFYDLIGRAPSRETKHQRRVNAVRDMIQGLRPARLLDVPITDQVEKRAFADKLPAFDRLSSLPRLFETAFAHFGRSGRFLTVHMEAPPAVMHWTYPVPVQLAGSRNVYTIHDLVPLRLPYTTLDRKGGYHALIAKCIESADHICTVSEASRQDILSRFPIDPARLTNTYQCSSLPEGASSGDPLADAAMVEGIFGLPHRGYFLFFGAIEPKKNLGRLIEAYLGTQTETPLVIVGARAWQSEEELRLLPKGDAASRPHGQRILQRVLQLEYLPRPLLLKLIRGARAVMFPSLFEGFGLPALEAMQLGTPVLASNAGSLPEVTGGAAVSVDPYDVGSIAEGLRQLDGDVALRTDLSARGLRQAEAFSADRYEARLAAMYRGVLQ